MIARPDDEGGRRQGGWTTLLWRELWSDRSIITPARYCVYDAFIGFILLGLAVLVVVEPAGATIAHAVAYGVIGLMLVGTALFAKSKGVPPPRLLTLDGVLLVCLALFLTGDSIVWALGAPARAPFRYAPGMILLLSIYGTMHLAHPGDDSPTSIRRRRRMRRVALITGMICELFVAGTLLARALGS